MNERIVVVGSTNVDLVMKMDRLPKLGETITEAEFVQTYGGKGANQAVAAARAGGDVAFVGCVGDDQYGTLMIDNLQNDGIDTTFLLKEEDVASGIAFIMVDAVGNNYISVAPGANYRITPSHIERASELLREADIAVLQCEIPLDTLHGTIEQATQYDTKILLNLAPAKPIDDKAIAHLDILVVNESEAAFLQGSPVETDQQVEQAARALLDRGPEIVIVTLGARGSYVATESDRWTVPAFPVDPVDTTGAGDVYCGSLAVSLAEGRSIEKSVRFASAAAAICVTRLGAQPSIPTREEIETFLAQQ